MYKNKIIKKKKKEERKPWDVPKNCKKITQLKIVGKLYPNDLCGLLPEIMETRVPFG